MWYVYLLRCADESTYTGIAIDVDARFLLHTRGRAARYTRNHPPESLVAALPIGTRTQASRFEARIKHWSRQRKLDFFGAFSGHRSLHRRSDESAQLGSTPMINLQDTLALHAAANQQVARIEAEIWTALLQQVPQLTEVILQSGLDETGAARWACFPVEALGGAPAQLIACGEVDQVLAYILRVTHRL